MLKHLSFIALITLAACDKTVESEPLVDFPVPALRNTMFEIDALNRVIEPIFTDPAQATAVASAARSMQRLSSDIAWSQYQSDPAFFGKPAQFNGYLMWLREGVAQLAEAAEQEIPDMEAMRAGFIRTQQSCIACHKRFQPNI